MSSSTRLVKPLTHQTAFYRENRHFHFVEQTILPEFLNKNSNTKPFRAWSSACASGEEAFTLAICLLELMQKHPAFRFELTASDISPSMLQACADGNYTHKQVNPIPPHILDKYFMPVGNLYKTKPALTNSVLFQNINLLDDPFPFTQPLDLILCRNVLLYYDTLAREQIVQKQFEALKPGGYLLIGHDESISEFNTKFHRVSSSIFLKPYKT